MRKAKNSSQKGAIQLPLLIGFLILSVALPITTRLAKQNQEIREKAAGDCPGGSLSACISSCEYGCQFSDWPNVCRNGCPDACRKLCGGGGGSSGSGSSSGGGGSCNYGVYHATGGEYCSGGKLKKADGNNANPQYWCSPGGCPSVKEANSPCCPQGEDLCQCPAESNKEDDGSDDGETAVNSTPRQENQTAPSSQPAPSGSTQPVPSDFPSSQPAPSGSTQPVPSDFPSSQPAPSGSTQPTSHPRNHPYPTAPSPTTTATPVPEPPDPLITTLVEAIKTEGLENITELLTQVDEKLSEKVYNKLIKVFEKNEE